MKEQKITDKIESNEKKQVKPEQRKPVERQETLIRILGTDIPGNKNVYVGLTRVKGISFAFSKAICHILNIEQSKKIQDLNEQEIKKITEFAKNPKVPAFLVNRRFDFDEGINRHLITTELDLRKEFDIKRLKKIGCYKGVRHTRGLPVRGQRTKSHFRTRAKHKAIGVKVKSTGKKG